MRKVHTNADKLCLYRSLPRQLNEMQPFWYAKRHEAHNDAFKNRQTQANHTVNASKCNICLLGGISSPDMQIFLSVCLLKPNANVSHETLKTTKVKPKQKITHNKRETRRQQKLLFRNTRGSYSRAGKRNHMMQAWHVSLAYFGFDYPSFTNSFAT